MALSVVMLFLASLCCAQDITGIWRGNFNSSERMLDMFNLENKYKFEVQIEQLKGNELNGVTYSYKTTVFYGKATADGSLNKKTGEVKLRELKTVEVRMAQNSYACIMTCYLKYSRNGDDEFLEGTYVSYGEKDSSFCGKGTVFLQKVSTSDFHKEPFLVRRSIEQQQREMLAANTPKKKPAPTGKSSVKTTTPTKPGTKKPLSAQPNLARNNPVKPGTGNNNPPSTGSAKNNPPKTTPRKDSSTAIARNTPPRPKPPVKKEEPAAPNPSEKTSIPNLAKADTPQTKKMAPVTIVPKVLVNRENELVKTINLSSREVLINIYDNGTIDHDTISVYLDKKLVVSKQMLTTTPITVRFTLDDDNEYHELVMVAENLGDIPPNTSLMVVKAGDQNMEVRITSTEQKNAVVAFRYKKPA